MRTFFNHTKKGFEIGSTRKKQLGCFNLISSKSDPISCFWNMRCKVAAWKNRLPHLASLVFLISAQETAILTKTMLKTLKKKHCKAGFQNGLLKSKLRKEQHEQSSLVVPLLIYSRIRIIRIPSSGTHLDFSVPLLNRIESFWRFQWRSALNAMKP